MGIFGHPKESKTDDLYEYGYGNESWTCCCATHKFSLGVEEPSEKLFTPNYFKNPPLYEQPDEMLLSCGAGKGCGGAIC